MTAAAAIGCRRSVVLGAATAGPELYFPGLFSTPEWDFFMAWSPDERRILFCRADTSFSRYTIYEVRDNGRGGFTAPIVPTFASVGSNADPHISRDGSTIFFISNRPLPGETQQRRTYDVWLARKLPNGEWGSAQHVGPPVSIIGVTEWSPSVAANGNLYFGSAKAGGKGSTDLWMSRHSGDDPATGYSEPINLGDSVNTAAAEIEPWISPDEKLLIFSAAGRPDSLGGYDLYASERLSSGEWSKARLLSAGVNSSALDFNQSVSPDGRWLYFSSTREYTGSLAPRYDRVRDSAAVAGIGNGKWGDIYRVPLRAALQRP